jgi:hypothetical protein
MTAMTTMWLLVQSSFSHDIVLLLLVVVVVVRHRLSSLSG